MVEPADGARLLLEDAKNMPDGPAKIHLLERAHQIAESCAAIELSFLIASHLFGIAANTGRPDLAMVYFSWCRNSIDRHPDRLSQLIFLFAYKFILGHAATFPDISLANIEELYADFHRRCLAGGFTLHAYYSLRRLLGTMVGNRRLARESHALLKKQTPDDLRDCEGCILGAECWYYSFLGEWEQCTDLARNILVSKFDCHEQPHRTIGTMLLPLFHLERQEYAAKLQRVGYRITRNRPKDIWDQAAHLRFQTLMGKFQSATGMVARHLPNALSAVSLKDRFEFLIAAHFWAQRLLARGKAKVNIRLPDEMQSLASKGSPDLAALSDWFISRAQEIARRFDMRNGNDYYGRRTGETEKLLKLAER